MDGEFDGIAEKNGLKDLDRRRFDDRRRFPSWSQASARPPFFDLPDNAVENILGACIVNLLMILCSI